ncbi:MAG: hypothetical protein Q8N35_02460 [Methylococcaceae bacterium]|nr:hypothetical protein [Methylococcaceae bacterium]MDZ4156843.1 hypothetical protein [Methylococcales bacterium]MDP2391753.1 hypothetical protein [Methylococcaceae bacterium]MDP3018427.1 hypothetical protein [Methylococcaceae bacterium]MDP3392097.1 hypothetical protein [Methylococcaceae bacterium]
MSNNDSWTPEEIARANERQSEINLAKEQNNLQIEKDKSEGGGIKAFLIVFAIILAVLLNVGSKARVAGFQNTLYGIMVFQAFMGSLAIRTFAGISKKSIFNSLGRVLLIAIFCVILFGLNFCSWTLTGHVRF